jgi:hypothetical protein
MGKRVSVLQRWVREAVAWLTTPVGPEAKEKYQCPVCGGPVLVTRVPPSARFKGLWLRASAKELAGNCPRRDSH